MLTFEVGGSVVCSLGFVVSSRRVKLTVAGLVFEKVDTAVGPSGLDATSVVRFDGGSD